MNLLLTKSAHRPKDSSLLEPYSSDQLDLVYLFHASNNIDSNGWASYKQFMKDVISGANINSGNVRVGAVIYNYESSWSFGLDWYQSTDALVQAIDGLELQADNQANLALGMDMVRSMFSSRGGDRPDAPNIVIVLTDAEANVNNARIAASAQRLKTESKARIYTAGIGLRGSSQLASVASGGSTVFSADNTGGLPGVKENIVAQIPPCKLFAPKSIFQV